MKPSNLTIDLPLFNYSRHHERSKRKNFWCLAAVSYESYVHQDVKSWRSYFFASPRGYDRSIPTTSYFAQWLRDDLRCLLVKNGFGCSCAIMLPFLCIVCNCLLKYFWGLYLSCMSIWLKHATASVKQSSWKRETLTKTMDSKRSKIFHTFKFE